MSIPATLAPRFPHVPERAGHYESVYLVATDPREPVAVWIRYTVHKPPGRPATGSIWCTVFDNGRPVAAKITDPDVRSTGAALIEVGQAGTVSPTRARGAMADVDAEWDLSFEPLDAELRHLPHAWMYRAPVPRTKSTSPYPAMRVNGTLRMGGRTLAINGWPGMLGHNWGAEHAHRWIWLRGAVFEDHPNTWLDVVIGQIKVGGVMLPWIANGVVAINGADGPRRTVGGLGRRVTVDERPDGCDLVLPGQGFVLTASVTAPISASVGWQYADPAGGRHQVRNCSAARLELAVRESARTTTLRTDHGGVYELGSVEFDPDVLMQPYEDG